jgi:hypothetical protein
MDPNPEPTISTPGSRSNKFFIPDPEFYMRNGMQIYFFLASMLSGAKSYSKRSGTQDPKKIHPGSRI